MAEENLNDDEKLRMENELRKLKLQLESGAMYFVDGELKSLTPEIENKFLDIIELFQSTKNTPEKISVYERIGKPDFKKSDLLNEDEILIELDRVQKILKQFHIEVMTNYEVENRRLYQFITEELMQQEIIYIKGIDDMELHFIYEDFYPNYLQEGIDTLISFFEDVLQKSRSEKSLVGYVGQLEDGNKWVPSFLAAYEKFIVKEIKVFFAYHDEESNDVEIHFYLEMEAFTTDENEKHLIKGNGTALLGLEEDIQKIIELKLPETV